MTTRVALYARYSSENQREASIEDQLRICRARAEREGWTVVDEFSDAAISGTKDKRPGFIALREAARAGKVDVILAESLDRFSRDLEHVAAFHKQATFCRVKLVTLAEGEISDLHVGVKGAMGALYLKDLAAKTHRGLEGRLRKGHSISMPSYGYRVVRRIGADGELERGLREVVPEHARIVRRIFEEYVAGRSPLAIARALNEEGVPSPTGRDWLDGTIRGRPGRGDGILRNPAYTGRAVWNRFRRETDPVTGASVRRPKAREDIVEVAFPEFRIVPEELWRAAQARLAAEAVATHPNGSQPFWERRRPKHLLTGKVVCGGCGGAFSLLGKDYLGCSRAKNAGACRNKARVRRSALERQVLAALGSSLMRPETVAAFCDAFIAEWNRMAAEMSTGAKAHQDELKAVERKIANLVEAIEDGLADPGVKLRLAELRARQEALLGQASPTVAPPPALHPSLAQVYANRVAALREAFDAGDGKEVLEAARALIETVVVSPPDGPGDPPGIELSGNLMAMLKAGGVNTSAGGATFGSCVSAMLAGSTKGELREKFPSPPASTASATPAIRPCRRTAPPHGPPAPRAAFPARSPARGSPPRSRRARPARCPRSRRNPAAPRRRPPRRPGRCPARAWAGPHPRRRRPARRRHARGRANASSPPVPPARNSTPQPPRARRRRRRAPPPPRRARRGCARSSHAR